MANSEHLDILKEGVGAWNRWREENPNAQPDLSSTSLSRRDIRGANLSRCTLAETHFNNSDLSGANLTRANLSRASLNAAHLASAIIVEASLDGANLSEADFTRADISYAILNGSHLTDANLQLANLTGAELSNSNLYHANLSGGVLRAAKLRWANLTSANLQGVNLRGSDLTGASFIEADLTRADLCGANLRYARIIESKVDNANFSNCRVYGMSAWDVSSSGAIESDLIITRADEPTITVDSLEVAQFVYLLLSSARIRQTIDTLTAKVVLILGRFTPERLSILERIREALRNRNYLPMLFDFAGPSSRDLTETVSTLAHLARFVIVDLTDARSIPQELMAIVPNLPSVPVQPLIAANQTEYGMFEHFRRYPWVLQAVSYPNEDTLINLLDQMVIAPAEAMTIAQRNQRLTEPQCSESK
jgi:uncharacterized protein YjbI with pentapeptide repeats